MDTLWAQERKLRGPSFRPLSGAAVREVWERFSYYGMATILAYYRYCTRIPHRVPENPVSPHTGWSADTQPRSNTLQCR